MKNRYNSEETIDDILNVATKLFLEKGYEKTSIQDIVNGLDGLTRGAIYHHFDSKEDIIVAVTRRLFLKNNFFSSLKERSDLNGLEKLQAVLMESILNQELQDYSLDGYELMKNPRFYVEYLKTNAQFLSPEVEAIIIEGNVDGSLNVEYPRYIAEALVLLLTGWFVSAIYPVSLEEFKEKFSATRYLFKGIGIDVFNATFLKLLEEYGLDLYER